MPLTYVPSRRIAVFDFEAAAAIGRSGVPRLDRIVLEQVDVGLGRAAEHGRVVEQDELLAGERAFPHQQPGGFRPAFDEPDEQADEAADRREADGAAVRGLAVGGDEHDADRVEQQPADEPAEHGADDAVENHLAFAQGDALPHAGRNGGDAPGGGAAHHQDQQRETGRHGARLRIFPKTQRRFRSSAPNTISGGNQRDQSADETDAQPDGTAFQGPQQSCGR